MNPNLTRNGFTPQFEREVLRRAAEPIDNDVEWDGVTPFSEFISRHPPQGKNAKNNLSSKILSRPRGHISREAGIKGRDKSSHQMVPKESQGYAPGRS